jgi:hypothetical protein
MRTLAESLFDKDLTKQSAHIGDVYELDEWTIPARGEDYSFTDDIVTWGVDYTKFHQNSPKWKNILKPLGSFPPIPSGTWMGNLFLKYMTELILCCKSVEQIRDVVKDYIMECRNDPNNLRKYKTEGHREAVIKHIFDDVEVDIFGFREEPLRMVTIKFFTKEGDYIICVTFKKRDV